MQAYASTKERCADLRTAVWGLRLNVELYKGRPLYRRLRAVASNDTREIKQVPYLKQGPCHVRNAYYAYVLIN